MKPLLITLSSALLLLTLGCSSPGRNTGRGAAVGATTGAVLGGVIGHQSGEAGAGAAIGAAVGGLAGGAYGSRQDRAESATAPTMPADEYLSLMTAEEIATLQARARESGRSNYQLTDFLTSAEKDNLRRRAAQRREIGR